MRAQVRIYLHPDELLNANDRLHWRAAYEKASALRSKGKLLIGKQVEPRPIPVRTRVVFTYCFPEKPRGKGRDAANWHPTTKAILDGIVDAGVWPDDNDQWVEGPDNRIGPLSSDTRPKPLTRAEVWVTFEPAGETAGKLPDADPLF